MITDSMKIDHFLYRYMKATKRPYSWVAHLIGCVCMAGPPLLLMWLTLHIAGAYFPAEDRHGDEGGAPSGSRVDQRRGGFPCPVRQRLAGHQGHGAAHRPRASGLPGMREADQGPRPVAGGA